MRRVKRLIWPWGEIRRLERRIQELLNLARHNERVLSDSLEAADRDLLWCRRRIETLERASQMGEFYD